ncbi:MAG TPA: polysaccharide deacetylase family protein [Acidimicrobiales bacterium]
MLAGTLTMTLSGLVSVTAERTAESGPAGATTTTTRPPSTLEPLVTVNGLAPVITRVATIDPVVFLTIDDGHTRSPELAAVLAELDVPTTLFLNDGPVSRDPDFFRSLPGATVESHTRSHADLRGLPEPAQRTEICGNADTIAAAFGRRPVLFRPPYGHYDDATRRAAAACGMAALVLWEETVEGGTVSYRSTPRLRPGDIVLFHFRPGLADELRTMVRRIEAAGLRAARLEDYLVPGG